MAKIFNTTGLCVSEEHYMVNIEKRLKEIRKLVDDGKYFTINRARQYGKTTTLAALEYYLKNDYYVVSMDFQTFGAGEFVDENTFSLAFAETFLWALRKNRLSGKDNFLDAIDDLEEKVELAQSNYKLRRLFLNLNDISETSDKPIVLMIDEVDSASNNQIFLDFLAQLRAQYLRRFQQPTFQSVILAGVHDVKNMKRKLRSDEEHKVNSPWNIAEDFKVDMSFSAEEIAGMLQEYETDHHTGMDIAEMAKRIYAYTSGYPYLVSRLCKLIDEDICGSEGFGTKEDAWSRDGFHEAVKMILMEKSTLFESLIGKLTNYRELNTIIETLLFTGKQIAYNPDNTMIDNATMYGFIKNRNGVVEIANRLFETRLYNYYLSTAEMHDEEMYAVSLCDKNQFVQDGHLNMRLILEKFAIHFNDLYGDCDARFIEEEGRKYFLLYLRPIINGTGNYYIESRTRGLRRTDVVVDYRGEQYVIEMKIWHGDEYNSRGEQQLIGYLEDYHQNVGYMISFNFNKNKKIGVHEITLGDKLLIEAVV